MLVSCPWLENGAFLELIPAILGNRRKEIFDYPLESVLQDPKQNDSPSNRFIIHRRVNHASCENQLILAATLQGKLIKLVPYTSIETTKNV